MIKISTRGRYAMRLMVELARNQNQGKPILLKDIARRQEISARYLEQLMLHLKAAGLVNSIRGAGGGFVLKKPAEKITLLEVFGASEGSLSLVKCLEDTSSCKRIAECASRELWQKMKDNLAGILGSQTLAELAEREEEKLRRKKVVYHI